jgi:hypothetical protein
LSTAGRKLTAIYCSVWKTPRIVLHFKQQRWDVYESLRLWNIREALSVTLEQIESAYPGSLKKASEIDDKNWLKKTRRTRRYIAESPDLIYINRPHLAAQSQGVRGYHVPTNIPWRDVPIILRLVCRAAGLVYGTVASIKF